MTEPDATASLAVSAPADRVYGWLTDLDVFATLTDETHRMRWTSGNDARVGAVFTGANRNGWRRWSTHCTVTDADPGRRFGFRVTSIAKTPVALWEYVLEPAGDGGCRVTESTWDLRPGWFRTPAGLATGVMDRPSTNQAHIEATLQRLREYAAGRKP